MPFNEEGIDGFSVERIRDDFIEGRFIEKFSYQEVIATPFGKEEVFERTAYRSTDFTVFSQFPQIELRNGQRSTKEFVSRLLELCNFSLVVSPVTVDLLNWVGSFQKLLGQRILIDSLQLSGVEVEKGIVAKILLKGDRDVRDAVDHIVGGKQYILEKVQIKIASADQRISVHLGNNGGAKLPLDQTSDFLPILRKAMPSHNG